MKRISTVFAAALCLAALAPAKAADLTMDKFGHSIKLQVSGYTGTETLQNFPVLVRVSETRIPGFLYSDLTNSKGADIAFFDAEGNHLASEIETNTWKEVESTSLIWVKLPEMTQGTQFYMCYNTSASGAWVTNENPWDDYVGVWHMDEKGGQNTKIYDATANALDGVVKASGNSVTRFKNGAVGATRRIAADRNHDWGIVVDATSSTKKTVADTLGTDFSASFWLNPQATDVTYGFLIDRRKGEYNNPGGWGTRLHEGKAQTKNLQIYAGTEKPYSNNYDGTLSGNNYAVLYTQNTWSKVDVHWYATGETAGAADIYLNGEFVETVALPQPPTQVNANIGIGGATQDTPGNTTTGKGRRFNGYMDEVRLRSGGRSADWIKADYDTVVNEAFVTIAPPVVAWTNASGATPAVASVHKDHVTFGGTVTDCGGSTNCAIQCKVWATGGTEPSEWTTLTNGLVALDSFTVTASGLTAETSYDYRLRAVGTGESASTPVSGSFTTLAGLAVSWSSATSATGLSKIGHDHVVVAGEIGTLGAATACEIQWKSWGQGETEPETWTTLTNGLAAGDVFQVAVGGKTPLTDYNYALRAVGNDDPPSTTVPVTGSFTTAPGLTVAWTSATASAGLSKIAPDFVTASGSVSALGGATACAIQAKVWLAGDSAPGSWTTVAENLALNASFNATVRETSAGGAIAPGTTYAYALRAVGNDGEETAPVTGTFTTGGEPGETIGSDYTKFFDDGTNACWVVKGFERYLPFTVTGYTGTETLTNFPVLVDVRDTDTNGFRYSDFYHYDGTDMAFVDDTGHIIPHEIDTWNKNGMSLIWVRLPRMNNGTTFTMCYRSPLIDPLPDVGNTFEKYVGVWHMNETQNGVASIKDSTANNLPGESHAKSLAGINQGQMIGGNARRVAQETGTSSSNGRIMVYDHDDILRTGVGNVFTFSGWYKTADDKPNWAYLVARKGDDYSKGWGVQYADDNAKDKLRVWSDPKGNKGLHTAGKGGYYHFDIRTYGTGESTGYQHGNWAYWTFVFSNNTFRAFHNGAELNSTKDGFTLEQPFANDETADFDYLVIGGMEFGTGAFNGFVDEARYSKGVRSPDWIKAEYDSTRQKDFPFVAKGTVSSGQDSPVPVVVWEKGANLPLSIIDVSYAYVQFAGTVTFCGVGADECRIEYQLWADGEEDPTVDGEWTTLGDLAEVSAGRSFSVPVTGLKQDMPYNFRIRAVNTIEGGVEQANRELSGSFRTPGNVAGSGGGELMRIDNRFVHRYRAGSYTFTTPDYVTSVEIMVVGGGGAGGYKIGGGGGGGGLFYSASYPVETNTTYRIQVGEGGSAATNLNVRGENGQLSYFARKDGDDEADETILISVPGGGAGGSYVNNNANIATGADGGSGGGGTYALAGGSAVSNEVDGVWVTYGYEGGQGNDNKTGGNQSGKTAAGGGGGAAREGVTASFDKNYGGGAGGAGIENSMTGERLFYGAGGGGGYAYKFDNEQNYTKPGAGGSGVGGNAADLKNGTPATSGVENTGAGGGGGSMILNNNNDQTYWQGGDGGDGVVLIAYEVHGRDPISEEPRITMTRCDYNPDAGTTGTGVADIGYRAYWAGIQADLNDLYVLYSVVSSNDVAAGNGDLAKVGEDLVGIGDVTFAPPEVGHTYWVRLVARKSANSFMYSDEIASFYVPAVSLNGVTWKKQNSASDDYAIVDYKLHDLNASTHLYCYWSESSESLEGDERPSGDGVRMFDVGADKAALATFNLPASEGLKRNKVYYIRLAAGDEQGVKHFLSDDILELSTVEQPAINLLGASWAPHVATLTIKTAIATLAPSDAEVFVFYSTNKTDLTSGSPWDKGAPRLVLGTSETIPDNVNTDVAFPLSSTEATTYYVRVAIRSTVDNKLYYSGTTKEISVPTPVPANTLIVYANANPKMGCYGDERQELDYTVIFGGLTDGPGWDHYTNASIHVVGAPSCTVTAASNAGQYDIEQGTLALSNNGASYQHPVVDPDTGDSTGEYITYNYLLSYVGAKYAVTNAVFNASFDDAVFTYDGESHAGASPTVTGIRNNRTVSYQYRVGSGEWDAAAPSFTDVGNYIVQFKASASNHTGNNGTFAVTINPAQLYAEISAADLNYTGAAQQPVITTNVTGRVKPELNPLLCEFRDEAGEWQGEAPAFTQPGEYKLYFRVSAPNHASFTTNCTVTVKGWDFMVNMDGQTGYPTPIHVSDPGWLLDVTKMTGQQFSDRDTRLAKLDEVQSNGLKLWQNYVIEREDLAKKLVAAIVQSGSRVNDGSFVVYFPGVAALRNTGLDVNYRIDRKLKGETEFTQGALSDKYEMNVPLGPGDPTGLYVFNMVLTSTNQLLYPGEAVLTSCATVGVLRVSSLATNTVTAAPWMAMSKDEAANKPVTVAEAVNPNGLAEGTRDGDGDRILVYNAAGDEFLSWSHLTGTSWSAATTVKKSGLTSSDADTTTLARGTAFWLVRNDPGSVGSTNHVYLVGRYTGDSYTNALAGGSEADPGFTLVANPTMDDVDLNDLVFVGGSPAAGDRIVIQDVSGFDKVYVRNGDDWGRYVTKKVGGRLRQTWVSGGTVPSGTGFWYVRTAAEDLSIRFAGVK